ncbi:Stk1 family PASTA domain-containing Ser/Thr kinase [Acetatifactor muris]|uniref:non-specific serine/threonine protein kinase n=1 Tax=Acetatifactor muris TaxID=879566 RepID=A0A2K4ZNC0_9FIRM|nr:Stk1 family PASTA domain-containing Ser/Thr kinase [Acetatifactor muris]MCR2050264.1 Stk1 family PASTA domain-containing Ser/Thr kinase [Acetatifactor muris]SOY31902.1 Serine/threonine-protein kinase PrkC [Acetatifactor muris]
MVKIGMMIGDRYEILEKIGTGGMSDVYKAKCHKLNRFVAVKVLKQEFSENESFVSKFRTEAQAAAGLMHPSIVNVYDVGEENGIYYIVMELVDGITLKEYIEKKARLSFKEAVSIAIQVSMGIEAAHNHHIIHRDIKPQNIMISRDGKVKVTDFGIAKAATSNTITSNVMGSVHYTSPEQARGGYSDEKSDIYSLGITMFEMLTGRVPFNGETTVAIAIKHIQEELPLPKEYVPEIPGSVESIVLKCCQKSPDRRYQNMQDLIADLKQSLMNPDEDFVVRNDPDMERGTRMISDSERAQIKRRAAYQESQNHQSQNHQNYGERDNIMHLRSDAEGMYEEEEEEETEDGEDYDYNPRMERVTTVLALLGGVVFCVVAIILAVKVFGNREERGESSSNSPIIADSSDSTEEEEKKTVKMPEVKGKSVEEVRNALTDLGVKSEVEYEESDEIAPGEVISADVEAGTEIEVGSTVKLVASAGPQGVEVPSVVGLSFEDASSRLKSQGFEVTKAEEYSGEVETNMVISQVPSAETKAAKGSNITVTVSQGKEPVWVPKLVGFSEQDGIAIALEAGLQIGDVAYVYHSEYPEGQICYQSHSINTYVAPETVIDIQVSKGPEPDAAPTYKCNASIMAPTPEEAPDYVAGTEVTVTLVTDDGKVLLETKTASFPQAANYYGLTASGGTVTMVYTVTVGGSTSQDPVTGEEVAVPGTPEERSFTRRIEFVPE